MTSLPTETYFKFKLEKKSPNVWISKSHPALQGSFQFPHGYLHRPSHQHWARSPCRIHSGTRQGRWGTGRCRRGSGSRSTHRGLQTETQAMLLQPSAFQCLGSYDFYNCQVPEYNRTSSLIPVCRNSNSLVFSYECQCRICISMGHRVGALNAKLSLALQSEYYVKRVTQVKIFSQEEDTFGSAWPCLKQRAQIKEVTEEVEWQGHKH